MGNVGDVICNQCKQKDNNDEVNLKNKKTNLIQDKQDESFLSKNNLIINSKSGLINFKAKGIGKQDDDSIKELITAVSINNLIKKIQRNFRNFNQTKKNTLVKRKTLTKSNNYNNNQNPYQESTFKYNYLGTNHSFHSQTNYQDYSNMPKNKEIVYKSSGTGFGIQIWQDNAKYIGSYENDKANGLGIFYHCDGDIYKGEFKDDRAHGYAEYFYLNGAKYEGYWMDDVQNGIGKECWKDNSFFEGNYKNGKKNGIGKYIWADGSFYEGDWLDNNIQGIGIYNFSDGRVYKGEWLNNMMNGFGIFKYSTEKLYYGYFKQDMKEGFGIYLWNSNGENKIYLGMWLAGKQHGIGKYFSKKGVKYGKWNQGERIKWFKNDENYTDLMEENEKKYIWLFKLDLKQVFEVIKD